MLIPVYIVKHNSQNTILKILSMEPRLLKPLISELEKNSDKVNETRNQLSDILTHFDKLKKPELIDHYLKFSSVISLMKIKIYLKCLISSFAKADKKESIRQDIANEIKQRIERNLQDKQVKYSASLLSAMSLYAEENTAQNKSEVDSQSDPSKPENGVASEPKPT